MKKIQLTQGKHVLVDDEDFEELNKFKWYACKAKQTYYACRKLRMRDGASKRGINVWMHRQILGLEMFNKKVADHIDGNGLNNQRLNLRKCTKQQNNFNRKKGLGRYRYKGIAWNSKYKKWEACLNKSGKCIFLGFFDSENEAGGAYNRGAIYHFGEFANLNIINDSPSLPLFACPIMGR